ncbi:unnamed protein product [Blepharisma stoltei]|uniref:Uncharacterized protein n=1 Tax=Blepharisma stoltei TaxID=1481888 RepID=A0AAU9J774_9CILI|nr:unnamed protein product [Blepharisma stoltei]
MSSLFMVFKFAKILRSISESSIVANDLASGLAGNTLFSSLLASNMPYSTIPHHQFQDDKSPEPDDLIGEWIGGKNLATMKLQNKTYRLMYRSSLIAKVPIADHESNEKALVHANKLLNDYCKSKKLINNEYRYMIDDKGSFLEVKVGKSSFFCDSELKDLVEKYNWNTQKSKSAIIAKEKNKQIEFSRMALGVLDKKIEIGFKDGNSMNLRKFNLTQKEAAAKPKKAKKSEPKPAKEKIPKS